jgi:hypothetical protein
LIGRITRIINVHAYIDITIVHRADTCEPHFVIESPVSRKIDTWWTWTGGDLSDLRVRVGVICVAASSYSPTLAVYNG